MAFLFFAVRSYCNILNDHQVAIVLKIYVSKNDSKMIGLYDELVNLASDLNCLSSNSDS